MQLTIEKTKKPKQKPTDTSQLGFGRIFTDHMFTMKYEEGKGWYGAKIEPYAPLSMEPSAMVLHYGQAVFEGMKAYVGPDGETLLFRPQNNFARFNRSAARMCIPPIDEAFALDALKELLKIEKDWIPKDAGTSLYIRPTVIATDPYVGVKASHTYLFFIILSPVGAYYANGLAPVRIFVEDEYVRAVRGGIGFTKAAANYAISLYAGEMAAKKGFAQVLWLDGIEHKYIDEVGSMNIFFKIAGELITPPLSSGAILPGITRESVMQLAAQKGIPCREARISIDEVFEAHEKGTLEEVFGTGTAAVISPVGELVWGERTALINGGQMGECSSWLYDTLTGIQYGVKDDVNGWVVRV